MNAAQKWTPVLIDTRRRIAFYERPIAEVVTANEEGPRHRIARVGSVEETVEAANANARRIAAVPDLEAACERILRVHDSRYRPTVDLPDPKGDACSACLEARAALAKARGES